MLTYPQIKYQRFTIEPLTPAVNNVIKHLVDYVRQPDDKRPRNPRR